MFASHVFRVDYFKNNRDHCNLHGLGLAHLIALNPQGLEQVEITKPKWRSTKKFDRWVVVADTVTLPSGTNTLAETQPAATGFNFSNLSSMPSFSFGSTNGSAAPSSNSSQNLPAFSFNSNSGSLTLPTPSLSTAPPTPSWNFSLNSTNETPAQPTSSSLPLSFTSPVTNEPKFSFGTAIPPPDSTAAYVPSPAKLPPSISFNFDANKTEVEKQKITSTSPSEGYSFLPNACTWSQDFTEIFIKQVKIDLNAVNDNQYSPLQLVIKCDFNKAVKQSRALLLLEHGADPHYQVTIFHANYKHIILSTNASSEFFNQRDGVIRSMLLRIVGRRFCIAGQVRSDPHSDWLDVCHTWTQTQRHWSTDGVRSEL